MAAALAAQYDSLVEALQPERLLRVAESAMRLAAEEAARQEDEAQAAAKRAKDELAGARKRHYAAVAAEAAATSFHNQLRADWICAEEGFCEAVQSRRRKLEELEQSAAKAGRLKGSAAAGGGTEERAVLGGDGGDSAGELKQPISQAV